MTEVPAVADHVAVAAQQHGLGRLVASREGTHPLLGGLGALAAAVVLGAAMWPLSVLGDHIGFRTGQKAVGYLGLFACFSMVGFLVRGIVLLIRGKRSYHVFADGFAYRHNTTVRALRWAEIAELRGRISTQGDNAGKIVDYTLVPQDGKDITVPLKVVDDRDPFMDALIAGLREAGRPIV